MSNDKNLIKDLQNSSNATSVNLMKEMYNQDKNTKAGQWFFDPDAYIETFSVLSNMGTEMSSQIESAQSVRKSVVGQLESPEGKEIEGNVESCIDDIISSAQSVVAGVGYILTWTQDRFDSGVEAGRISLEVVKSIHESLKEGKDTGKYKVGQYKTKKIEGILSRTHTGEGKGTVNSKGESMYQGQTFLETMENCWLRLYNNGKTIKYTAAEIKDVPFNWSAENWNENDVAYTDCSSFVTWVLYEYGYEEFGNREQLCTWDYTNEDNTSRWAKDYNWDVKKPNNAVEAAKEVKAGDIVVYDGPSDDPSNGHMFIVKDVKEDGTIVTYDAGTEEHWTSEQTQAEIGMKNEYGYTGSEEGTVSGYFKNLEEVDVNIKKLEELDENKKEEELEELRKDDARYRECTIISIEDVTWDEVDFVNSNR